MQKLVLTAVTICAVVWVALVALTWMYQERVVFQPPRGQRQQSSDPRLVRYAAKDGTALFGYLIGNVHTAPVVMLAFHGNADLARWQLPWAEEVARTTGAAVFLAEYRGYDGLEGTPTYAGANADAHAALKYLRDSARVDASKLVYFGHSLGSAVATELATQEPPSTLILQSPFTSARAMAGRFLVPGSAWLWPMISRVHFDTRIRVQTLDAPVWVAHGERDMVIPASMGRAVFDAAKHKGELLVVPGAGHNDVAERGADDYWNWLRHATSSSRARAIRPGA